jgi:hypothetical protein
MHLSHVWEKAHHEFSLDRAGNASKILPGLPRKRVMQVFFGSRLQPLFA